MKTLEEILERKLIESDTSFEKGRWIDGEDAYNSVKEAMKEYADEYAKEALRLASENAIVYLPSHAHIHGTNNVDKQSILSENNLPKHI